MNTISYNELFEKCQNGRMSSRPGYYSGRGPLSCDLNSGHLENFYHGIKIHVSEEAAARFVRFVNNLTDLSATAFLVAFEDFYHNGLFDDNYKPLKQRENTGNTLSGRGKVLEAEAFGCIAAIFGRSNVDPEQDKAASNGIKKGFVRAHENEIPAEEHQKEYTNYGIFSSKAGQY